MKSAAEKADIRSRAAVKKTMRREDRARLARDEEPAALQRENSIFPAGFFDGSRIANLRKTVGR